MPLQDIPEIILLCMEKKFSVAFEQALSTSWPAFQSDPKITISTRNERLAAIPASLPFELVVSPANSYGRLDGAFDDAISRAFCLPDHPYDTLTHAVQRVLYDKYRGFAPSGTCTLVPFPDELHDKNPWGCKWVAVCPTMRTPQNVTWDREIVYKCVWSLLCELERWNRDVREGKEQGERIDRIVMTPMATGCGRVSPEKWAAQLVLAMKYFADAVERPQRWSRLDWGDIYDDTEEVEQTWNLDAK